MACEKCRSSSLRAKVVECGCKKQCQPACPQPCGCKERMSCGCSGGLRIRHIVVQTTNELQRYRNSYVIVRDEGNALYHVDENGNPLVVHRQNLYENEHEAHKGKYKSTLLFDMENSKMFVYDPEGNVKQVSMGDV